MKKILFILFLSTIASYANTQTVVIDSTWLTNTAGVFYVNRYQVYDNGNANTTVTKVGDTTSVITGAQSVYISTTSVMAGDANYAMFNASKIQEIIRQDIQMQTQLGKSVLNSIALMQDITLAQPNRYFTVSGWTLKDNTLNTTTIKNITFSFGSNGSFRYKLSTESINLAYCFGDIIRIMNYDGQGYALDFYKRPNGTWATIDLQQILIPPSK